jgi:Domain of unknown function (DUF4263)
MPSLFKDIAVSTNAAEAELSAFRTFLDTNETFSEKAVVAELKRSPNLSCLIGHLYFGAPRANVYKFEFPLIGSFVADLVVGNLQAKKFALVEFESGNQFSLFKRGGTLQNRDWSAEFEHGFGQLIDWAWIIDTNRSSQTLLNLFGCDDLSVVYLLVCGRNSLLRDDTERKRHFWRSEKCKIEGATATCLTYDGLFEFFQTTIEAIKN